MSVGGYLIIDDFNLVDCRRAIRDFFEWHDLNMTEIVNIDNSGSYWKKKANTLLKMEKYKALLLERP